MSVLSHRFTILEALLLTLRAVVGVGWRLDSQNQGLKTTDAQTLSAILIHDIQILENEIFKNLATMKRLEAERQPTQCQSCNSLAN